eukprot:NODE_517_length_2379_cov_96.789007_g491_i0.p1 GENE.NODE_517_length_2379_cov_96.789007_g491_i0~~NODE_517_length_2379_cov_96.789007_g491_i0.p1  ORF type:complete len:705 (+),score=103.98 NODE_517_length_2379_cov_96.789007_g491_i0:76-2190(+)
MRRWTPTARDLEDVRTRMSDSPSNAEVQQTGCQTISDFPWVSSQVPELLGQDCVHAVLHAIALHPKATSVHVVACRALSKLTLCPELVRHVTSAGSVLILSSLRVAPTDSSLLLYACQSLINLCQDADVKSTVVALQGEELLTKALQDHPELEPVISSLASVLGVTLQPGPPDGDETVPSSDPSPKSTPSPPSRSQHRMESTTPPLSSRGTVEDASTEALSPLRGTLRPPSSPHDPRQRQATPPRAPPQQQQQQQHVGNFGFQPAHDSSKALPSGLKVDLRGFKAIGGKGAQKVHEASSSSSSPELSYTVQPRTNPSADLLIDGFRANLKTHALSATDVSQYSSEDLTELLTDVFQYNVVERNKIKAYLKQLGTGDQNAEIERDTLEQLLTPPSEFICSVSGDVMQDPVFTADGHTYDRAAITKWFRTCAATGTVTSPNTGLPLTCQSLVPNHSLRSQVEAWKEAAKKIADKHKVAIVSYDLEELLGPVTGAQPPMLKPHSSTPVRKGFNFSSPAEDLCDGCGRELTGPFVRATGKRFHTECFKCGRCSKVIVEKKFGAHNGAVYHAHCLAVVRGDVCAKCRSAISGTVVTALEVRWHEEFFSCAGCKTVISDDLFTTYDGRPYHPECDPTDHTGTVRAAILRNGADPRARGRGRTGGTTPSPARGRSMGRQQLLTSLRGQGSRAAQQLHNALTGVTPFRQTVI